ncbi:MAG: DUF134 domain-containing protein [Candidatus Woesearchaeota archaeon]
MHNLVRPRKIKIVNFEPCVTYFKPHGVPLDQLEETELTIDELETLRLLNIEKMSQSDAATKMRIHQSTFQRTLARATAKVTDSLVNGKAIKIQGGEYEMPGGDRTGPMGMGARTGRGMGFCNGYNSPGFARQGFGRKPFRRGFGGFGRGMRRMFLNSPQNPIHQPSKGQEKQMLEDDLKQLEAEENAMKTEKESIKKRLEELGD